MRKIEIRKGRTYVEVNSTMIPEEYTTQSMEANNPNRQEELEEERKQHRATILKKCKKKCKNCSCDKK